MAKKLFDTKNIIDTAVNVGIGGAANVAIDYAVQNVEALSDMDQSTINLGKFALGVIGSAMVSDKMVKAAFDGVATVGISNFVANILNSDNQATTTAGVPDGTIGARKYVPSRRALANRLRKQQVSGAPNDMVS